MTNKEFDKIVTDISIGGGWAYFIFAVIVSLCLLFCDVDVEKGKDLLESFLMRAFVCYLSFRVHTNSV